MKMFFVSLSILFSITSCFAFEESEPEQIYMYNQIPESLKISWDDILSYDGEYDVYIYDEFCKVCQEFRQEILSYTLNDPKEQFYFISCQDSEVPKRKEDLDNTKGCTDISELFINGTPALIGVDNHTVSFNIGGKKAIKKKLEI